jgi:hypothetical protein
MKPAVRAPNEREDGRAVGDPGKVNVRHDPVAELP